MRYSLILAGGTGTRLWPLSREDNPKQLLPFIGGRSLLDIAYSRLEGLIAPEQRYICGGADYMEKVVTSIPGLTKERYLYEPFGRDTLNALAYSTALIARNDPDAVIAVFTADHVIEPEAQFRNIIDAAFSIVEQNPSVLLTFGVTPTHAATGYGYLKLGGTLACRPITGQQDGAPAGGSADVDAAEGKPAGLQARVVEQFQEKPDQTNAEQYFQAGPRRYLWNSGMFLWKASTFLSCVEKFQPDNYRHIQNIAAAFTTPGDPEFDTILQQEYEKLTKISVDFAVMEPASVDRDLTVAALPLSISWIDIGSWPAYAEVCAPDDAGNAANADKVIVKDSSNTLVVSDDDRHLITVLGMDNAVVVHTANATLVCSKEKAQEIKELRNTVRNKFGEGYV